MVDNIEVKTRSELASIIKSLELTEARFELASLEHGVKNQRARDRALVEVRRALAAARLAAAAYGGVPGPARH